jgi:uncharacterized protein (TIGR02996 family)
VPTNPALLAAVLETPDDDAPRLVYADWLEENGEADRAAFIRLQIELARLPEGDPRAQALELRACALLQAHNDAWRAELPAWALEVRYERGFVVRLDCALGAFLKRAAGLFRRAPVRVVHVRNAVNRQVRELAASPHLARLAELEVEDSRMTPEGWRPLLTSPGLAGLPKLALNANHLTAEEVGTLAASPHLTRLTSLSLCGRAPLGDEALRHLAGSPHLRGLRELRLSHSGARGDGLRALAGSPHLGGLTVLALRGTRPSPDGLAALVAAPRLAAVRELDLSDWSLGGNPGAEAVARALAWPNLTGLRLSHCHVGLAGARALAACAALSNLTLLDLSQNYAITDDAVRALAESPHLARLTHLCLHGTLLREEGVRALVSSPHLKNLTCVGSYYNGPAPERWQTLRTERHL